MLKMCSKCGKRPAVVFIADASNKNAEPSGLCLVCAKQMGLKPVDDLLNKMNISDEDIAGISDQMMEMMEIDPDDDEQEDEEEMTGGAPAFPFLNNIFGSPDVKENKEQTDKKTEKKKNKKRKYLNTYCIDLTKRAREGKIDAIVGREAELYRTIQILSRRSKNNPCLIGEPGVGKTAIAEGLALKIASNDVPARLLDKEIFLLDLTGLVAGTQFRGQFESRVKGLVEEIKAEGNIILFIDEIHNIVGAGNSEGAMNASNILKPALSRGEIHVIGATTLKEYRQYIEKDAALERRFQPVMIEEPTIDATIDMLKVIKTYYEGYHNVKIPDEIAERAVILSERYISDRFLPDKAIDLIDEASACASLKNHSIDELYVANKKIADLLKEEEAIESDMDNVDYERLANVRSELAVYREKVDKLSVNAADNTVTEDDLAQVIELWTGIPASKIKESDLERLSNLEQSLFSRIKGQDEAVKKVAAAVKRSRVKINNSRRPASFIFVGPTGVGKTELAKALSEFLFNTPETLIRFDMSEFMEKHSVSRLIGAPPGYVGYEEAGQLTEKVRRKPYSVILFDEIEKAHPDVLNVLLQVLDDGRVTDAQGRVVNFENTIIIMTSNAGSDRSDALMGFGKTAGDVSSEKAVRALEDFLRPEFLARVDETVVFQPLGKQALSDIAELALSDLAKMLKEKNIDLSFDKSVCDHFAETCNGSKRGARDLKNNIRKNVEDAIVEEMIANYGKVMQSVNITYKNDLKISYKFK